MSINWSSVGARVIYVATWFNLSFMQIASYIAAVCCNVVIAIGGIGDT